MTIQKTIHTLLTISEQYLCTKDGHATYEPIEDDKWSKMFIDLNGNEAFKTVDSVPQGEYEVYCDGEYLSNITI